MAGVETITNEILQEAKEQADAILAKADKDADAVRSAAAEKGKKLREERAAEAEKDAAAYEERIRSQIEQRDRRAHLAAKQEIIRETIGKAYEKLDTQDEASYFSMIEKLIGSHVHPESGEIFFSKRDLARLPEGFSARADAIAKEKGGSLQLSREAAPIENGFILRYGGIEENCSLKALFEEKQNALQDEVMRTVF